MTLSRSLPRRLLGLALALLGAACGPDPASPATTGAIGISAAVSSASVTAVEVSVTGAGIASPLRASLTRSGGAWTGTIDAVPAGADRVVEALARDAGGSVLFRGTATGVSVAAGVMTAVTLVLQEVTPPPPYENTAPVIDGVTVSTLSPIPGETISLGVTAHDVDPGAVLTYRWAASSGTFAPVQANTAAVQWTAPSTGAATFTISVTVTDEKGLATTASFDLTTAPAVGAVQVDVTTNAAPVVTAMTATPGSAAAGQPISLTASATDADGDPLHLAWSADCAGTFAAPIGAVATFTPGAAPAGNLCHLTVAATDGRGGSATGTVGIWVGLQAPPVTVPGGGVTPGPVATLVIENWGSPPPPPHFTEVIIVRALDASGRAVPGATVQFSVDGATSPASVVTGADGRASTTWLIPRCTDPLAPSPPWPLGATVPSCTWLADAWVDTGSGVVFTAAPAVVEVSALEVPPRRADLNGTYTGTVTADPGSGTHPFCANGPIQLDLLDGVVSLWGMATQVAEDGTVLVDQAPGLFLTDSVVSGAFVVDAAGHASGAGTVTRVNAAEPLTPAFNCASTWAVQRN
jgi:hypothetical protein